MARTFTIRGNEAVPVDRQAASVVASGPKWCEPKRQQLPNVSRRVCGVRGSLRALFDRMSPEQRNEYSAMFDCGGPAGYASPEERNAWCRLQLSLPVSRRGQAALTVLANRSRAAEQGRQFPRGAPQLRRERT